MLRKHYLELVRIMRRNDPHHDIAMEGGIWLQIVLDLGRFYAERDGDFDPIQFEKDCIDLELREQYETAREKAGSLGSTPPPRPWYQVVAPTSSSTPRHYKPKQGDRQ